MMYGLALPIMFPIAAITFFNYYTVDRFLVAYYYRRPPIYDEKLNNTALETMKFAPLLLFFFGYWTMGNMQIFNSKITPLTNSGTPLTTDHGVAPSGDQALPLFIVGMITITVMITTTFCSGCLRKMHLMVEDKVELVDENVGNYYQCVPLAERKRWYAQELHADKNLGISTMGKNSMDELKGAQGGWRVIKNAPNYEILANINYCQAF